jgi:hypothetical protein
MVYASYGRNELRVVRRIAGQLRENDLADVVRLSDAMAAWREVPMRLSARLRLDYDAVSRSNYVDIRRLLVARLLALNPQPHVRQWLVNLRTKWTSSAISEYERALIASLLPMVGL